MSSRVKKRKLNLESSEDDEAGVSDINKLSDESLIRILSYLPAVDKIRVERVCKRWQVLSKGIWKNVESLTFFGLELPSCPLLDSYDGGKIHLKTMQPQIYRKILSLCGQYIESLSLSDKTDLFNAGILSSIAEFCRNLKYLRVNHISEPHVVGLSQLLSVNKSLKVFTINNFKNRSQMARCLRHLPRELEDLRVRSEPSKNKMWETMAFSENTSTETENYVESLNSLLERTSSLIGLNIDCGNEKTIELIGRQRKMKRLSLESFQFSGDELDFKMIAGLKNLVEVDLAHCSLHITDDVIINLAQNCPKLKALDINECYSVSIVALKEVFSLKNLRSLNLSNVNAIDDQTLDMIPSTITHLGLSTCNITDDGVQPLIKRLTNLQELDLRFCGISNETINVALEETLCRTNNQVLTIMCSDDVIFDDGPFVGKSKLLKLLVSKGELF